MSESAGTPRTEAFAQERLGGPAQTARYRTNIEWKLFAADLERELADCQKEIWRREKQYRALESRLASHAEREGAVVKAYCAANDYINALMNPSVPKESLEKIAADYWQNVREVK